MSATPLNASSTAAIPASTSWQWNTSLIVISGRPVNRTWVVKKKSRKSATAIQVIGKTNRINKEVRVARSPACPLRRLTRKLQTRINAETRTIKARQHHCQSA